MKKKSITVIVSLVMLMTCAFGLSGCALFGGGNNNKCQHDFGAWETLEEADCEKEGLRIHTCNKCDETFDDVIPAYGHEYRDYVCVKCGSLDNAAPETAGLEYELAEDGESYIVTGGTVTGSILVIPAVHENKPVTAIKAEAFTDLGPSVETNKYSYKKVIIPESVKEIGALAFWCNANLKSVYGGSGLTKIGSQAFAYCRNLTKITIAKSVEKIDPYALYGTVLSELVMEDYNDWVMCQFENGTYISASLDESNAATKLKQEVSGMYFKKLED